MPEIENVPVKDRTKEITDKLEEGIKKLFEGDKFRNYLDTMSKFHDYSFNNTLLIAMQKPDATLVAGFNAWKNKFQRNVNKGEKGIQILAPAPYTIKKEQTKLDKDTQLPVLDDDGKPVIEEIEVKIPAFKVVSVFDVSQTSGKELPTLGVDELKGDVKNYEKLFEALKSIAPVPVSFEDIKGGAKGYFDKDKNLIAINEGMSETQTVKTAIHEIAHSILHNHNMTKAEVDKPKDRNTEEVEAESIAYTVCQHFGIDTSDYSFAYVASWGSDKELPELKASLETIRSTSNDIINKVENILLGRQKEQVQDKAQKQEHSSAVSLPKTKEEFNIIGNTPYKDIADKNYLKLPTETALAVSRLLEEKGIKFSGRVNDDKTTLTISKSDIPAYNKALEEVRNSKIADSFPEPKVSVEYHSHFEDRFVLKEAATGGTLHTGTKQELIDFCEKNLAASVVTPQLVNMIDKAQAERPVINHFDIPVYLKTAKEARELGELDLFKQNENENRSCRDSISKAVSENYKLYENGYGGTFDSDAALKQVMEKYPLDRISLIVASRISGADWDKRFTAEVHKWADDMISSLPENVKNALKYVQTNEHSGLVNTFAEKIMSKHLEIEKAVDKAVANDVQQEMDKGSRIRNAEERDARLIIEEPLKEAMFINGKEDTIAIYQLKHTPENHDISFAGLDFLEKMGKEVSRDNYTLVYSYKEDLSKVESMPAFLSSVFEKFNINHPRDFEGHSLSVSDVVAIKKDNRITSYYVDSTDFKEIPQFVRSERENTLKAVEDVIEQNDNSFDGVINNLPPENTAEKDSTIKKAEKKNEGKRSIRCFIREAQGIKKTENKSDHKQKGMEI
ncbi:MAG: DUF3849 domain-containing protein [Ruminococcus sp.]|nr:DUF3849 domain-containing protein [Ruminococcus sp.]